MEYSGLYMGKKQQKKYNNYSKIDYLRTSKLKVLTVDNGIILPAKEDNSETPKLWAKGGIVTDNDVFVEESCTRYLFGGYYDFDHDLVEFIDEEVIFMGPFIQHWGHFLCDQISRLWYAIEHPKKYKIAYCGWNWNSGNNDITGNFLEIIELMGIDKEQLINVQRPTKFKKIIIPELSFIPDKYYAKEFEEIVNVIYKNNVSKNDFTKYNKIYFTREELGNNKEIGENDISVFLKNNGFTTKAPEKLSASEQITILNNSKNVCMISGSISHNIMFCNNPNVTIIILNKTEMINGYQMIIDHICKAKIVYIDIYKKEKSVLFGMGPFLLHINKYLQDYFHTNIKYQIPSENYIIYRKNYKKIYSDKYNRQLLKQQKIQNQKK